MCCRYPSLPIRDLVLYLVRIKHFTPFTAPLAPLCTTVYGSYSSHIPHIHHKSPPLAFVSNLSHTGVWQAKKRKILTERLSSTQSHCEETIDSLARISLFASWKIAMLRWSGMTTSPAAATPVNYWRSQYWRYHRHRWIQVLDHILNSLFFI